jgi:hypothetical protein
MDAVIHAKVVRRPISGQIIGYRLEAAVPNQQGRKMKPLYNSEGGVESFIATHEAVPSFKKPYLVAQSSDYNAIDKTTINRFLDSLRFTGFRDFEFFGKVGDVPLADLAM